MTTQANADSANGPSGTDDSNGSNSAKAVTEGIHRTIWTCIVCEDIRDVKERTTTTPGVTTAYIRIYPDTCFTCGMVDDFDAEERVQNYKKGLK
ncbi:hypothetical protein AK830_g8405 [Neonectria ditissima]|uniref:Uncharacterized protein n=1 Tax=Neonectria ditissima TaxID=78410 RepID=A0A0P7BEC3_9HYPO|nr:hypothetical protein AK830_g8405 [Neonectria ditissima]